jgi:hypothetical protein
MPSKAAQSGRSAEASAKLKESDRRYWLAESKPIVAKSAEHREELILELARDLLALQVADAEVIRREFGRRFGTGELGHQSSLAIDRSRMAEGVVTATITITSVRDWDKLVAAWPVDYSMTGTRGAFRDHGRQRARWPKPETSIRAVAIHYLSARGGGRRPLQGAAEPLEGAAELYATRFGATAADTWDAAHHARTISQIEDEYGLLP